MAGTSPALVAVREADSAAASAVKAFQASGHTAEARERYAELVGRHQRRATRIAYHYLRDAAEADEAVQDAFVKAYSHLSSFREELPFDVWFTRILINGCLDRIKAGNGPIFRGKFHGIFQDIPKNLLQPGRVAQDDFSFGFQFQNQRYLFRFNFLLHGGNHIAQNCVNFGRLQMELKFSVRNAGNIEHVVDEPGLRGNIFANRLKIGPDERGQVGVGGGIAGQQQGRV